jgi:hypothetical protein
MFRSSVMRLRAWLELADDLLGDPAQPASAHDAQLHSHHPHRRPLRWQRERRPGAVPAAPAYCLCPVRPATRGRGARQPVAR